jgi:hypothetical protein
MDGHMRMMMYALHFLERFVSLECVVGMYEVAVAVGCSFNVARSTSSGVVVERWCWERCVKCCWYQYRPGDLVLVWEEGLWLRGEYAQGLQERNVSSAATTPK